MAVIEPHRCAVCGEDFRLAWLMGDPPEPYGDVCGCPEVVAAVSEAGAEKRAMDAQYAPVRMEE